MSGTRALVLVGGGHAHALLLRAFATTPIAGVRTIVVLDRPCVLYSGMVPGLVAGRFGADEPTIDVAALAARAGATVVPAAAARIEPDARRIELDGGGAPLGYDVASIDVGSTVAGLALPGVAEHALATRPIARFVESVDGLVARAVARGRCRIAVVGGGAGGVEVAFAFRARLLGARVSDLAVTLLEAAPRVLPESAPRISRRVGSSLATRGIALRTGVRVEGITRAGDGLRLALAGLEPLPCDEVAWVAGAAPPPLVAGSPLPHDGAGFVRIAPTLEVEGCDGLFAAGDCAGFAPPLPKAGVYAVRQAPVLAHNLRARLAGAPLRRYRPQRDFLRLLDTGDGAAIAVKWGIAVEAHAACALKDRIDRRFVARLREASGVGGAQ